MKRVLTPEAEAERYDFDYEYGGGDCSCHLSPPCNRCTHHGNPENQADNDKAWMEVDDDYDGVEE